MGPTVVYAANPQYRDSPIVPTPGLVNGPDSVSDTPGVRGQITKINPPAHSDSQAGTPVHCMLGVCGAIGAVLLLRTSTESANSHGKAETPGATKSAKKTKSCTKERRTASSTPDRLSRQPRIALHTVASAPLATVACKPQRRRRLASIVAVSSSPAHSPQPF
jgi:hypothetical protein